MHEESAPQLTNSFFTRATEAYSAARWQHG
jgi:hypothetical protein